MATLRFHLPKLARRTPPSGDAGTSAPTEYPSSPVGALTIQVKCQRCGRLSTLEVSPLLSKKAIKGLEYTCGFCGLAPNSSDFLQGLEDDFAAANRRRKIVEGDGPQESGVTPSPSIDTDRLNKLLIEAAATMREQNDRLAAVNAALDQLEDDYARRKHGGVAQGIAISSINRAMGR